MAASSSQSYSIRVINCTYTYTLVHTVTHTMLMLLCTTVWSCIGLCTVRYGNTDCVQLCMAVQAVYCSTTGCIYVAVLLRTQSCHIAVTRCSFLYEKEVTHIVLRQNLTVKVNKYLHYDHYMV